MTTVRSTLTFVAMLVSILVLGAILAMPVYAQDATPYADLPDHWQVMYDSDSCMAAKVNPADQTTLGLRYYWKDDSLTVGLLNDHWTTKEKEPVKLVASYYFDGKNAKDINVPAEGVGSGGVVFDVGDGVTSMSLVAGMSNWKFTLSNGTELTNIDLKGSKRAMAVMYQCIKTHRALDPFNPPAPIEFLSQKK